jgi:hypothetical protein
MPTVDTDGIATHYEISGSGQPILLMAPGGFDSAIVKWSTTWPWQHFLPLQAFARDYTPPDRIRDRVLDFFSAHAG